MQKISDWVKRNVWASIAIALFLGWGAGSGSGADLSSELASAKAELASVKAVQVAEVDSLSTENASLEVDNSDLEQELEQAESELSELQDELDLIRSKRPLPDFVGAVPDDIMTLAHKFDWDVAVVKEISPATPGTIIGQVPSSGTTVQRGSEVQIVVAKAPPVPKPQPVAAPAPQPASGSGSGCDPNYQGTCVPQVSYDLNCDDIGGSVTVVGSDPHGFDGDNDGYGCE